MHKIVARALAAFRLELRLLLRHWSFWVVFGLWSALLGYLGYNREFATTQAALKDDVGNFGIGLLSLVALFVAGASAARPHRRRFAALDAVLPTGAEVIVGRWLASLAASLVLLVPIVAVAVWRGSLVGFWASVPLFAAEAGLTLAFCTAASYWLVTRFGQHRWVYPLLSIGWLLFLALPHLPIFDRTSTGMRGMALLSFMRMDSIAYEELWGRMLQGALPGWFNAFYLGCTAVLVAGVIRHDQRTRRRRTAIGTWLVLAGALVIAGGSAAGFWQTTAALAAHENAGSRCPDPLAAPAAQEDIRIEAYTIDADVREPTRPAFRTSLVVRNLSAAPVRDLALTLHRELLITAASVPFEQADDHVLLRLPEPLAPNQTMTLELEYAGAVLVTGSFSGPPQAIFFSHERGVRLASAGAWYPLAGAQTLQPLCRGGLHHPAAFDLSVRAPAGWQVVSNLDRQTAERWSAKQARWSLLMVVPGLAEEQVGAVTLITMPSYLHLVRPYAARFERRLAQLGRFFPNAPHDRMTLAMLDSGEGIPMNAPAADRPFVYQSWTRLTTLDQSSANEQAYLTNAIVNNLWQPDPTQRESGAMINLVQRQAALFLGQLLNGDAAGLRDRITAYYSSADNGLDPALHDPIVFALIDEYEQDGEAGVIRLIERLQAEQALLTRLSKADLADWLAKARREN